MAKAKAKKKKARSKPPRKRRPRRKDVRTITGGRFTWDDLGDDRIPRWPSKIGEKRRITVHITTWIGTCAIDARHYNLSVDEEDNMWWCERENAWVEINTDTGNSGLNLRACFLEEEHAVKVAIAAVLCMADPKTHRLSWDGIHDCPKELEGLLDE